MLMSTFKWLLTHYFQGFPSSLFLLLFRYFSTHFFFKDILQDHLEYSWKKATYLMVLYMSRMLLWSSYLFLSASPVSKVFLLL